MQPRGALNMAAGKERERKAGKVVLFKNYVPEVVTQEDVDEYGSVKSARIPP